MDAKDLCTEPAISERSKDGSSKYPHSGIVLPSNSSKSYQDVSSNSLAKGDTPTSRPCAVIGPDRVLPPQTNSDLYLRKGLYEPWQAAEATYRHQTEYSHKMPNYQSPLRNISPRQTFQENMPRIMVPPTYNSVKINEDSNYTVDRQATLTKNKLNGPLDPKYCEVPYPVNSLSENQKNSDLSVSNLSNPRNCAQMWHQGSINVRSSRPYGASEVYQYPEYAASAGHRTAAMARPQRLGEDPSHMYADSFYHENNVRFKPYPKERYPQARYEYISNYANPFHPPPPFPTQKYDHQKTAQPHPHYPQVPIKYLDNRANDPLNESYQRSTQHMNYNVPYRSQIVHPAYGPMISNSMQNKLCPYPPEVPKAIASNKLPYDNKIFLDYENSRNKSYSGPENYYVNDIVRPNMKNQVLIPNYPNANMQQITPHHYYRKENQLSKNYEYLPHYRYFDPTIHTNNNYMRLPSQISPNTFAISPSDSNTSNDTAHTQGTALEDCGYVSQSSSTSARSTDLGLHRFIPNDAYRRHNYPYPTMIRMSPFTSKPELSDSRNNPDTKGKKSIDVRQYLQMWNEGDEENNGNKESAINPEFSESSKPSNQYEVVKNQEQLYVLGLETVPSEELGKYEHIQKVSKLPDNIKGYNNIELLKQFEEAIESSNLSNFKVKNCSSSMKTLVQQSIGIPNRPLSPLDVEAKISQSVIHKEVGCNFEIKPCSPEMLNVEVATPLQNIIGERIIEKVTNPLIIKSPVASISPDNGLNNIASKKQDHSIMLDKNLKISSCKMINQCTNNDDINALKPNYCLQDLESNSGVCLASLPRLDNDIELNFPEVNQQFINANKVESVIIKKDVTNTSDKIPNNICLENDTKEVAMSPKETPNTNLENEFSKLSKYRKTKKIDSESKDYTNIYSQCMRTDSVIIKNPENSKSFENNTDTNASVDNKLEDTNQQSPVNLSPECSKTSSKCQGETESANKNNKTENEVAIDFSFKTETSSPKKENRCKKINQNYNQYQPQNHSNSFKDEIARDYSSKACVGDTPSEICDDRAQSNPEQNENNDVNCKISFNNKETPDSTITNISDTLLIEATCSSSNGTEKNFQAQDNTKIYSFQHNIVNNNDPIVQNSTENNKCHIRVNTINNDTLFQNSKEAFSKLNTDTLTQSSCKNESKDLFSSDKIEDNNKDTFKSKTEDDTSHKVHYSPKKMSTNDTQHLILSSQGDLNTNSTGVLNSNCENLDKDKNIRRTEESLCENNIIEFTNETHNLETNSETHNLETNSETHNLETNSKLCFQGDSMSDDTKEPSSVDGATNMENENDLRLNHSANSGQNIPEGIPNKGDEMACLEMCHDTKKSNSVCIKNEVIKQNVNQNCYNETNFNMYNNVCRDDSYSETHHDAKELISEKYLSKKDLKLNNQDIYQNTRQDNEEPVSDNNNISFKVNKNIDTNSLLSPSLNGESEISNENPKSTNCDTKSLKEGEQSFSDSQVSSKIILLDNQAVNCNLLQNDKLEMPKKCEIIHKDSHSCNKNINDSSITSKSHGKEKLTNDLDTIDIDEIKVENESLLDEDRKYSSGDYFCGTHVAEVSTEGSISKFENDSAYLTDDDAKTILRSRASNLRKELFSPWFQKLILKNEGPLSYSLYSDLSENNTRYSEIQTAEETDVKLTIAENHLAGIEITYLNENLSTSITETNNSDIQLIKAEICQKAVKASDDEEAEVDMTFIENQLTEMERNDAECKLNYKTSNEDEKQLFSQDNHSLSKNCLPMKRSMSDSALDRLSIDISENITLPLEHSSWRRKRRKIEGFINVGDSHFISDNIQHNRRNSVSSSFYNDDNVSFCIVIDNNCIINEENEEEKICYTEISDDCLVDVPVVEDIESSAEVLLCPQEANGYPETFVLEMSNDKSFEETWIDDVACVETVVSDEIAEDITISAPSSPQELRDLNETNSDILKHIQKVKYIYGDSMCNDDADLVDTLYRTPQMNVNKTLTNRESHLNNDHDENTTILNGKRDLESPEFRPMSEPLITDEFVDVQPGSVRNNDSSTYNKHEAQESPALNSSSGIFKENITQDETVNSCESSSDDLLSYNKDGSLSYDYSSSPEVSSTTSEEKNSSIFLKITNCKGMITSELNDVSTCKSSTNSKSCKFTESVSFTNYDNPTKHRPLLTKAAKKYIPPSKEHTIDLKVKLPLPEKSLLKLKQLKVNRNETKNNNNLKKDIPKKPKPKFEDVLKNIDEIQIKMHKEKKKPKKVVPKVVIKKRDNGSHYASTSDRDAFNPDLTGRKWQPWVFLEKNNFIDKMALRNKTKAIFNYRKKTYVFADKFRKYKSSSSAKFVISQPTLDNTSAGNLKYTIRLKHSY